MTDVIIGFKRYRNIENVTDGKLDHLLQLIDIQIANYSEKIKNYPPRRMEGCGKPFLAKLQGVRQQILDVQTNRSKAA